MEKVIAGSPAEEAGVKKSDVVLEFGGRVVKSIADLKGTLFRKAQGEQIEMTVLRNEEEVKLTLKLGARKDF